MLCKQCGTENKDHVTYCKRCGAQLKKVAFFKDRKKLVIAAAIIIIAAIAAIISITLHSNLKKNADYNGKLQTADKYLQELEYEKAEDFYLEAIKIEPKKEDAYVKLSDLYIAQGEYDKAVDILEKGNDSAGGSKFKRKLEQVRSEEKKEKTQKQAFYDLCMEYQQKYGKGQLIKNTETVTGDYGLWYSLDGLCVAQLLDFNGDGNQELLLGYLDPHSELFDTQYCYEVWAWKDGAMKNILEKQPANHIEGIAWIETTCKGNHTFIVADRQMEKTMGSAEYYEYQKDQFEMVYSIVLPSSELGESGSINGVTKSDEEVIKLHNGLARPCYPNAGVDAETVRYLNENGKKLYFPLSGDGHVPSTKEEFDDFNKVLKNTQETLNQLDADKGSQK